jgi:flagellar basal-body rod protein FlgB
MTRMCSGKSLPPRVIDSAEIAAHLAFRPASALAGWPFPTLGMRLATSLARHFSGGSAMPINLDTYLGVHAKALPLRSQRTEVLAANIANADTPGYRARDIDFKSALAAAGNTQSADQMKTTQTRHISTAQVNGTPAGELKYRNPLAPALDGNTVDTQLEQAAFAENSVRYQATLSFLSSKFRGLLTAITGQ